MRPQSSVEPATMQGGWRALSRCWLTTVALATVLVVAACTPKPLDNIQTPAPPPPPSRVVPDPLPDRDAEQVFTEVLNLDWCALLDPGVVAQYKITEKLRPGIGRCSVDAPDQLVFVEGLVDFGQGARFGALPINLGGAKAYRSGTAIRDRRCDIHLPIDHTRAIVFSALALEKADCAMVEAFAAKAASTLLANPGALRRPAGGSDGFDLCRVLESALGPAPINSTYGKGRFTDSVLTNCGLWQEEAFSSSTPLIGLELNLFEPESERIKDGFFRSWKHITVAGASVMTIERNGDCEAMWDVRPAHATPGRVITASANSSKPCAEIQQQLPKLISAMASATPPQASGTQLLYRFDEPDLERTGLCADVRQPVERQCVEYTPGATPATGPDLITRGRLDPNVLCASTEQTIPAAFPRALKPVTVIDQDGAGCEYVLADHSWVVRVFASNATLRTRTGTEGTVGGHASNTTLNDTGALISTTCLAATTDDEPGIVCLEVFNGPTREYGNYSGGPSDPTFAQRVAAATTQLADLL